MSIEEFRALCADDPNPGLSAPLLALLQDSQWDWSAAHESAQREETPAGAWVHAYLHRKEGDLANAAYWYRRAGRPVPTCNVGEEWAQISGELLAAD